MFRNWILMLVLYREVLIEGKGRVKGIFFLSI